MHYIKDAYKYIPKSRGLIYTILLLGVFLTGFSLYFNTAVENFEVPESQIQVAEVDEAEERMPELPVRLLIPAINVDANIQHVGLDTEGTGEMEVPSNFTDVGWYQLGVLPGMKGSAVIAGHYNGKETPQAVFYDLEKLSIGDEVVVMSEAQIEEIFQVVKIETYDYDAPTEDVFISNDGKKRLNLITCGGQWLPNEQVYNKRTVVFTELLTNEE